jgi:glutamate-1-semialdehyde 2,1-aminomutase
LSAYREVLPRLRDAVSSRSLALLLRGRPLEPVFRKTSKFNTRPKPAA